MRQYNTSCVLWPRFCFDFFVVCVGPHISNTLGQRGDPLYLSGKCPVSSNDPICPGTGVPSPENPLRLVTEERSFALVRVSERQLECLAWVQEGKSASDIGGILCISSQTVEGHLLRRAPALGLLKASAP